jgi:hypothetical protein
MNFGLNKAMMLGMISRAPSILRRSIIASNRPIRAWNISFDIKQNTIPQTSVVAI